MMSREILLMSNGTAKLLLLLNPPQINGTFPMILKISPCCEPRSHFQNQSSLINQNFQLITIPVGRSWSERICFSWIPKAGVGCHQARAGLSDPRHPAQGIPRLEALSDAQIIGLRWPRFIRILWTPGPFPLSPGHKVNGMTQLQPRARQGVSFPAWQQLLIPRVPKVGASLPPALTALCPIGCPSVAAWFSFLPLPLPISAATIPVSLMGFPS